MKRPEDIILEGFLNVNLRQLAHVPIIAVYDNPKDYPGKFVARLWDIRNKPTRYIVLRDSLNDLRQTIPKTLQRLPPTQLDDPILVETYL